VILLENWETYLVALFGEPKRFLLQAVWAKNKLVRPLHSGVIISWENPFASASRPAAKPLSRPVLTTSKILSGAGYKPPVAFITWAFAFLNIWSLTKLKDITCCMILSTRDFGPRSIFSFPLARFCATFIAVSSRYLNVLQKYNLIFNNCGIILIFRFVKYMNMFL